MDGVRRFVERLLAIADAPGDDDDTRLRKRMGVAAGYLTIVAPLSLPLQALGHPLSYVFGLALSGFSVLNLLILARTRWFERYVVALIAAGAVWVPLAGALGGGVLGSSTSLVWAFLVPAYAILALGPRPATVWFVVFLASLLVMGLVDPLVRSAFDEAPYEWRLLAALQNTALPLTIVFLMLRYTDIRRRRAEARSEELLTNAIPAAIALRLKRGEQRIAERYPETTILFADIVEFTPWAGASDPARVVSLLDELFSRFDALTAEGGLEKVKTVGDAYMAVAGAPEPLPDHATAALATASRMLEAAEEWRARHDLDLQLRIGLASGPVVGGVIGDRRILFDLWGDTVNLASRMESSSLPGRVQVSPATRDRVTSDVRFEARQVDVKGVGPMTTYLLIPS